MILHVLGPVRVASALAFIRAICCQAMWPTGFETEFVDGPQLLWLAVSYTRVFHFALFGLKVFLAIIINFFLWMFRLSANWE